MSTNKINKLRIEKRQIQSELRALQPKLSKGIKNTRKHQSDAQKVTSSTLRLSSIEADISAEENQLVKLKNAKLNIDQSPLLKNMFKTPPKHIAKKINIWMILSLAI